MLYKTISCATCIFLTIISFNAGAALIDITATSTDSRFSGFTLTFDDKSADGLLQLDEVVQFSGFTLTNPVNSAVNGLFDVIIGTADIAGISTSSGVKLFSSLNWNFKRFDGDKALCCSSTYWEYSIEPVTVPASVNIAHAPVPAAAWLFGSGLICLVQLARRKS